MKIIAASLIDDYLEDNALVIDLRPAEDYMSRHVRGAVSVPVDQIEQMTRYLPRDRTIVLYCERGNLSVMIGRKLSHQGFKVASVNGGIQAYHGKYLERR